MVIFNITSADFVLICIENDHNFERNEDRATVFLKWTDFKTQVQNFVGFIFVAILKREEARLSLFWDLQQQQILLQKKIGIPELV